MSSPLEDTKGTVAESQQPIRKITHDLNNMLSVILANLQLLGELEADLITENGEEMIGDAISASEDAIELVKQLEGLANGRPNT